MTKSKNRLPLKQGQRLADLRKRAGLSQYKLARLLGVPQSNFAFGEHSDKPPRSDLLPKLADILSVKIDDLIYVEGKPTRHISGPAGKMRLLFDKVSTLPRSQQEKILDFVSLFFKHYENSKHSDIKHDF
jgi:transcriptional regulator with XRE-family HTH domain